MAVKTGLDLNTDRMVLCLDANYDDGYSSSASTWYDKTGNGHASAVGTTSYSESNRAFTFSSNGDMFTLNDNTNFKKLRGDVTLMGWCNQLTRAGAHQTLLCTDATYRGGIKLLSSYHGNVAVWLGNSDGTDSYTLTGAGIENSGWKFIATTRDVTTGMLRLFINGSLVNNVTTYTGKTFTNEGPRVGSEYHSGGYFYNGHIASAYAFSRVLPDSEILSIYNKQKSRFGL
jgi:hypothetical protein